MELSRFQFGTCSTRKGGSLSNNHNQCRCFSRPTTKYYYYCNVVTATNRPTKRCWPEIRYYCRQTPPPPLAKNYIHHLPKISISTIYVYYPGSAMGAWEVEPAARVLAADFLASARLWRSSLCSIERCCACTGLPSRVARLSPHLQGGSSRSLRVRAHQEFGGVPR